MWELSLFAALAGIAWAQAPVVPPLHIVDTAVSYPVLAQSLRGINAELRDYAAANDRAEQGHTRSEIEVSSQLDPGRGHCRLASAEVSLDVTTTLPLWQARPAAGDAVRGEWARSLARLQRHEAGHRANAIDAAEMLRQSVLALPPQPNCLKLQMAISLQLEHARWQLELRDENYDLRTRNGLRDDPRHPAQSLNLAGQDAPQRDARTRFSGTSRFGH